MLSGVALEHLPRQARELAEHLGLPAALTLVERLGGTTIPVPMRATTQGEARFRRLEKTLGTETASALCRVYGGTDVYIPNCRGALIEARDAALNRERDALAAAGLSERDLVEALALRYKICDRQVWRILKKPTMASQPSLGAVQARLL